MKKPRPASDSFHHQPPSGPLDIGASASPFGKCSPSDCNWGTARAYPQYDGWIKSTYNFGFKTSSVWLKTYSYYGLTYLRVWVYNDFTPSDGRTDYTTDEWFLR